MTLKEKKYQLITSLLSINKMENLEFIERTISSVAKEENNSKEKMSIDEYKSMIDKGLKEHIEGNIYTKIELKSYLRLNS